MRAQFTELPAFERHRQHYLDDDQFRLLQVQLMRDPECGAVIAGTVDCGRLASATSAAAKASEAGCE